MKGDVDSIQLPGSAAVEQAVMPSIDRARRRTMTTRIDPFGILGIFLFVAVWQILTIFVPSSLLPIPLAVARRVAKDFFSAQELSYFGLPDASLLSSMLYTVENVVVAVIFGAIIGAFSGLVTARFRLARSIFDPVVLTAGTVPILVAAPFFLIWFGVGRASAAMLVLLYVAITVYLFAQKAADNLDPVYEESARTLGATSRRIVWDMLIPGTVPQILGGVRIALAGAWGLEAIAELLGSQYGIGKAVELFAGATDVEGIFAALLVLGIVAVVFDATTAFCFGKMTTWSVVARPGCS
jgi:ABC-type nitrate/sulfonate/bicarbonate transport system permease component